MAGKGRAGGPDEPGVVSTADEDIWVPRFKRYREAGDGEEYCKKWFSGQYSDGALAWWFCWREKGHSGPCVWHTGEINDIGDPDGFGEYQEYWELEDGEEEQ